MRLSDFNFNDISLIRDVFIETGTFQGETLVYAMTSGFSELHSIEVSERNYKICLDKFSKFPNVKIHLGSSPDVLPTIIDGDKSTTFWLDAHYQNGNNDEIDNKYGQCPLLEELKVIMAVKWKIDPFILIDDSYMFTKPLYGSFVNGNWPKLNEIEALILPKYKTTIYNNIIYCMPI